MKLLIMQPPPVSHTSSLLGSNTVFSNLVSNTLELLSSLNVNEHVSYPYKTGKTVVG